jgi:ribonuclease E
VVPAEPERAVEAEPETPVHGLSAEIIIAPVVLPEPVAVVAAAVVLPEPAEPLAAQADLTAALVEAAPKLQVEPVVQAPQEEAAPDTVTETIAVEMPTVPVLAPTEPVPTPVEPISAPVAKPAPAPAPKPEAAPPLLVQAAAVEVPAEAATPQVAPVSAPAEVPSVAEPQDTPAPDAPPPEPQTAEPVPPLAKVADEAAESREADGAIDGLVDAARGTDATDDKAGR